MNNYILVFLTPVINLFLFELFFFYPKFFYLVLILVNLLILFSLKKITGKRLGDRDFWNLSILPILFSTSLIIYSALLTNRFFVQFLFIINLFFTYYYLKNVYSRSDETDNSKAFLENIYAYGNFLILFFASASAYGLKSFLNISIWLLILVMAGIILLTIYGSLWANKITIRTGGIYIFIVCLALIQLAWAIYFLPLSYNTLGLILAICYYILMGLVKSHLKDNLNKKVIKLYLIFGLLSMALILLTARWA